MNVLWPSLLLGNELDSNSISHDREVIDSYVDDPLVHSLISPRLGISMLEAGKWALDHAGEFALPLLLMHGEADPFTSIDASRTFAERLSGDCSFKTWEGMYHEIHNETGNGEVLTFIIDWLNERTDKVR